MVLQFTITLEMWRNLSILRYNRSGFPKTSSVPLIAWQPSFVLNQFISYCDDKKRTIIIPIARLKAVITMCNVKHWWRERHVIAVWYDANHETGLCFHHAMIASEFMVKLIVFNERQRQAYTLRADDVCGRTYDLYRHPLNIMFDNYPTWLARYSPQHR